MIPVHHVTNHLRKYAAIDSGATFVEPGDTAKALGALLVTNLKMVPR